MTYIECRAGCGACCIAPSISSAIPGMPDGKPTGVRCFRLTEDNCCAIRDDPRRPAVCGSLRASIEMCGETALQAYIRLARLEKMTRP
jgi:hypothetical protein